MKNPLQLKRFPHETPDLRQMDAMIYRLERLVVNKELWRSPDKEAWLQEILAFQTEDGGFALVDNFHIESDARVHYWYEPSYLCAALLMREYMASDDTPPELELALTRALRFCCGRGMRGHGFDDEAGEEKAMGWFLRCDLEAYHFELPPLDPAFHDLVDRLYDRWRRVFVYGSLLSTGVRHGALGRAVYRGSARIEGYTLYELGSYPAARQGGRGDIHGEVYLVHLHSLRTLDLIEGQGQLFRRYPVLVHGERFHLYGETYLLIDDPGQAPVIPESAQPYGGDPQALVWYAAYGSNMSEKRLALYIQGGLDEKTGKVYTGCRDKTLPRSSLPVLLPHERYYAQSSSQWEGQGVAFLDSDRPGRTRGRAWLITRGQLEDIRQQEGPGWYDKDLLLGRWHGIEVRTLTHSSWFGPEREPSARYQEIIKVAERRLGSEPCIIV